MAESVHKSIRSSGHLARQVGRRLPANIRRRTPNSTLSHFEKYQTQIADTHKRLHVLAHHFATCEAISAPRIRSANYSENSTGNTSVNTQNFDPTSRGKLRRNDWPTLGQRIARAEADRPAPRAAGALFRAVFASSNLQCESTGPCAYERDRSMQLKICLHTRSQKPTRRLHSVYGTNCHSCHNLSSSCAGIFTLAALLNIAMK